MRWAFCCPALRISNEVVFGSSGRLLDRLGVIIITVSVRTKFSNGQVTVYQSWSQLRSSCPFRLFSSSSSWFLPLRCVVREASTRSSVALGASAWKSPRWMCRLHLTSLLSRSLASREVYLRGRACYMFSDGCAAWHPAPTHDRRGLGAPHAR